MSDLKQLLHVLESKTSRADIILLCETFLTKSTESLVKVPGYTLICSNRKHSKGGGTAILLQNGITFKRRTDIEIFREKEVESTIIGIVAKDGKKIVVCSMYRPPNTDPTHFITSMNSITSKSVSEKKEIILGMDHNLDLLKSGSHKQTQLFLNDLLDKEIYTTITHPTRICHNAATLIDNVFISKNLHKFFESAILIEDISDHLPLLILLKQTKLICNKPIEFETRKLNAKNIKLIIYILYQVDWTKHLSSNSCSENFDFFTAKVNEIMDSVSPLIKIRISAKRRYREPWMTRGLEKSGLKKLCLYKETLKASATRKDITLYKDYRNVYNKTE